MDSSKSPTPPRKPYSRLRTNYILGQPLGEGSFSTVYLAKRPRSGQLVVLKQIDLRFFIARCLSINPNDRPTAEIAYLAARRMYVLFEEMLVKYKRENAKQKEEL